MSTLTRNTDIRGMQFGKLTVLEDAAPRIYSGCAVRMMRCRCDCGEEFDAARKNITGGKTRSCGCLRVARIRKAFETAGKEVEG